MPCMVVLASPGDDHARATSDFFLLHWQGLRTRQWFVLSCLVSSTQSLHLVSNLIVTGNYSFNFRCLHFGPNSCVHNENRAPRVDIDVLIENQSNNQLINQFCNVIVHYSTVTGTLTNYCTITTVMI